MNFIVETYNVSLYALPTTSRHAPDKIKDGVLGVSWCPRRQHPGGLLNAVNLNVDLLLDLEQGISKLLDSV